MLIQPFGGSVPRCVPYGIGAELRALRRLEPVLRAGSHSLVMFMTFETRMTGDSCGTNKDMFFVPSHRSEVTMRYRFICFNLFLILEIQFLLICVLFHSV